MLLSELYVWVFRTQWFVLSCKNMIPLSSRKHFKYNPNVCLLVLMLTVLMVREAMSATGYIPSNFQEEKGDFPNVPRNGPFQRTGTQIS